VKKFASPRFARRRAAGQRVHQPGDPAEPPLNFKVVAGDASAVVTWMRSPTWSTGSSTARGEHHDLELGPLGGPAIIKATSRSHHRPHNGRTYSATINGRRTAAPAGRARPRRSSSRPSRAPTGRSARPWGPASSRASPPASGLGLRERLRRRGRRDLRERRRRATPRRPIRPRLPTSTPCSTAASASWRWAQRHDRRFGRRHDVEHEDERDHGRPQRRLPIGTTGGYFAVGRAAHPHQHRRNDVDGRGVGTTNDLSGATFGAAKLVVVGSGGTILTSADGATWTAVTSGPRPT